MKTPSQYIKKLALQLKLVITIILGTTGYTYAQTCVSLSSAPSSAQNYIVTYTPRVSGITNPATLPSKNTCQVMQTVKYFDGLGRLVQTVQTKGNPNATKDLITPVAYDGYGRTVTQYMPYTASGTSGSYRTTAFADQSSFYNAATPGIVQTTKPYSQVFNEFSPLNRPLDQGAQGTDWQPGAGHSVRMSYTFNNHTAFDPNNITTNPGSHQALYYTVTNNSNGTCKLIMAGSTVYNDNELEVIITRDENWSVADGCTGKTEQYKDKEGRVVLKRTYNYNAATAKEEMLSTYYVYDDFGDLCFVLPPAANPDGGSISQSVLDNLCYQYLYDGKNRMVAKKIPGKGWDYVIYNKIDQPIASQDSVQRMKSPQQVSFTKYDAEGRVIETGFYTLTGSTPGTNYRASMQSTADAQTTLWESRATGTTHGYTDVTVPTTGITLLTVMYYDDNSNIPNLPAAYTAPTGATGMTRGLLTSKKTAVLNTPSDVLWNVNYYDVLNRSIETYQQHYLGGTAALNANNYDAVTQNYDFTNAPTSTKRMHYVGGALVVTVNTRNIYDHLGRKIKHWQSIQNAGQTVDRRTLIDSLNYNEIGQIWKKHLHSTDSVNFKQDITYAYNERGWLLTGSAQLFEEQLQYNSNNTVNGMTPVKQYNGNISAQSWGLPGTMAKTYAYQYDRLNRLTNGSSSDNYNESNISYDLNGNITALKRTTGSTTLTDNLAYVYLNGTTPTNQLKSITDATTSDIGLKHGTWNFTYDGNGNLLTDPSKGITTNIVYNILDLPQSIADKNTTYTYDATGQKLRRVIGTAVTDYIGGIEYDGTTTAETISFIQTEEGRALPNGAVNYNYEYYLTDHLGNSRIAFDTKTSSAVQVQADDYYPFGMEQSVTANGTKNEYLYNRKELQENTGLYDYGARFFDPVIARWNVIDPLAEKHTEITPYNYGINNPISVIDPTGADIVEGPFGIPIDLPAVDHFESDGGYQVNGTYYSKEAFEKELPDIAQPYLQQEADASYGVNHETSSSTTGTNYYASSDKHAGINNNNDNANQGGPDMRPASPGSYYNAAGQIIYNGGVVQNWSSPNGDRHDAQFITKSGQIIEFPGASFSPYKSTYDAGFTLPNGSIYLDPANGLADLEHEYGHFLDAQKNGAFGYSLMMPISLLSATFDSYTEHLSRSYELRATNLAIQFFGPTSAIALATKAYPR